MWRLSYLTALGALALFLVASPALAQANDVDCSDFSTRAEAEQYLLPGDPHRLDADDDGIPCETLPPGDESADTAPSAPAPQQEDTSAATQQYTTPGAAPAPEPAPSAAPQALPETGGPALGPLTLVAGGILLMATRILRR